MCYIVVLNPLIIGTVPDSTGQFLGGGAEPNLPAVAAGTALIAGLLSIFMGAWAKFPLALATGLGLERLHRLFGGAAAGDDLGRGRWASWCSRAW